MVWAPEAHFERHLPLTLLTGFLGSGKTTLLNRLLQDPRLSGTAVAVNEFGDVGLDQHFIEGREEDVILLANGCMCCFASADLEQSLARIFQRSANGELPDFKRLIIETSGMADPEFVLQAVLDNPIMSRFLWLDTIITTVDALFGAQQIDRHHEAAKQVLLADKLVITKSDMADETAVAALQDRLKAINARGDQLLGADSAFDAATLFSPTFFDENPASSLVGGWVGRQEDLAEPHRHPHRHEESTGHASDVKSTTLTADTSIDWHRFVLWLGQEQRKYGDKLLRVKGILDVAGNEEPVVVHAVQSVLHVPVSLKNWPTDDRRSRIVFILRDASETDLQSSWETFLSTSAKPQPAIDPC